MADELMTFGKVEKIERSDYAIDFKLTRGIARVEGISKNIIRLRLIHAYSFPEDRSYSIMKDVPQRELSFEDNDDEYIVSTGGAKLIISRELFGVSLADANGDIISKGSPFRYGESNIIDSRYSNEEDDYFALGEKITPLGRRGYRLTHWNTDDHRHHNETNSPMYISLPFMISLNSKSKKCSGYFLDSSYKSDFHLGNKQWDLNEIEVDEGEFNVYFMTGEKVKDILQSYTSLTGTHEMPPIWALGYNQCRWSYMSTEDAKDVADNLRDRNIPCDVMWYDIDYMDEFRVFTFDKENFGNIKEHLDYIGKKGFKKIVIVDPGVKVDPKGVYDVNDQGTEGNHFLKNSSGEDYVGKVWPGGTKFPDFTKPETREWWGDLHKRYYDVGVDAFWNDMNEPADHSTEENTIPSDIRMFDDGRWSTQRRMHNVYATFEAIATVDAMLKFRPNERPFLLTRAGFSGIQKYSALWCGDNTSTWSHLEGSVAQLLNMGLSGIGFVGVDVGGFNFDTNPELLTRWSQLGAFYPFFRNHSSMSSIRQEPWLFGKETERIIREAIELRYTLLPYFYQLFYEMHTTGAPIMRPMFWDNQDDEKTHKLDDQFMLGSYILAAPVLKRGRRSRSVYFPEGIWYDYFTGDKYQGGKEYVVQAPLDKIPMFVKSGSIIPVMDVVESTAKIDKSTAAFLVVPGNDTIREDHYEDDLLTNDYKDGKFCFNELELTRSRFSLKLSNKSAIKKVNLHFFSAATPGGGLAGFMEDGVWLNKEFRRESNIVVDF